MSRLLKIWIYFPILWNGFLFTGLAFGQRERQLNGLGKYSKHHLDSSSKHCEDRRNLKKHCAVWAKKYCKTNQFVKKHCKKSCDLCPTPELATLSTGKSVLPMSTCPKLPRVRSHDVSSEDLIERAAKQVESELIQMTQKGPASHSRFKFRSLRKKATIMSRAISGYNTLFRQAKGILRIGNMTSEQATNKVKEAFRCNGNFTMGLFVRSNYGNVNPNMEDVWEHFPHEMCSRTTPKCDRKAKFRTITGQCNNLRNPLWGASITPHSRLLPSIPKLWRVETFMDGPSGSGKVNSVEALEEVDRFGIDGSKCSCSRKDCVSASPVKLPNVRLVSTKFFTDDGENTNDNHFTHMLTQFGQLLDHDLTFTPEEEEEECCEDCESKTLPCERESCYPIFIPPNDPFYQSAELKARGVNQSCIDHSRSTGFCSEGFESRQHEQFNMITAFVDASNVYGSENKFSRILRTLDGTGKLRTENNTFLLPRINIKTEVSRRAGDTRALEMPGLASVHTVFVREHNQLCDALKTHPDVDSTWGDEDFYQNARRILIAEMQKIVYDEYLPIIMGRKGMRRWGLNVRSKSRYYRRVDPSQPNSFGTAAFRFGHTMIRGLIEQFKSIRDQTPNNKYELGQNYFNLTVYEASGGAGNDFILNGLMRQQSAAFDRFVTPEVSNKLFASGTQPIVTKDDQPIPGVGADLMSRNLQRGRDHGLPSYAAFYKRLNKRGRAGVMDCWDKRPPEIKKDVWHLLRKIYNHPHHIDLFVGGLAESPFQGGVTGRTFQAIIGITFGRLKFGDRFFFTRRGYMNKAELDEIKRRSFGDIICDTSTFIKSTPKDVFRINSHAVQCDKRKGLNIRAFRVAKVDSEGWVR